jgi:very-short-patch-repair endonuclease
MTPPEVRLWLRLRSLRAQGVRFRRQHPIGPYVLDFYCPEAKLAVEVDGWGHALGDQPRRDERRDAWLAEQGILALRFTAAAVLKDPDEVAEIIHRHVQGAPPQSASPTAPP